MAWTMLGIAPAVAATPLKVVIIVGPTGAQTDGYRSTGNSIAAAATAAGAEVVKVYSPKATWARVRNAVVGANVVVYLGHGNGSPNPYGSAELSDRHNGWGLNRTTTGGDVDNWSTKMVYCGEKAILGTLTAADGSAQWNYCGGKTNTDGLAPAANWVMIYNKACYAPGASEGWDTKATESVAFQRVRNYSYPALKAGAGAYFATDMYQGGQQLVDLVLRHRDWTFGAIAEAANGYSMAAQRRFAHPDLSAKQVWIQRTNTSMGTDYWYAYAGRPSLTPSGAEGVYVAPTAPKVVAIAPARGSVGVDASTAISATFDQAVTGVSGSTFKVTDVYGLTVSGTVSYDAPTRTARFMPAAPLESAISYKASLSSSIRNGMGTRMSNYSWTFAVSGELKATTSKYSPAAELTLAAGTNTGYTFSGTGTMASAKHGTLSEATVVTTTLRRSIANQAGAWFYVASGSWKGYWMRESDAVSLSGAMAAASVEDQTFSPAATLGVKKGTHTGYKFSSTGSMTGSKTATVPYRKGTTTALQSLPGQSGLWFRVTSSTWSGYWLRASNVVVLVSGG
jgi:hypothetical protein